MGPENAAMTTPTPPPHHPPSPPHPLYPSSKKNKRKTKTNKNANKPKARTKKMRDSRIAIFLIFTCGRSIFLGGLRSIAINWTKNYSPFSTLFSILSIISCKCMITWVDLSELAKQQHQNSFRLPPAGLPMNQAIDKDGSWNIKIVYLYFVVPCACLCLKLSVTL